MQLSECGGAKEITRNGEVMNHISHHYHAAYGPDIDITSFKIFNIFITSPLEIRSATWSHLLTITADVETDKKIQGWYQQSDTTALCGRRWFIFIPYVILLANQSATTLSCITRVYSIQTMRVVSVIFISWWSALVICPPAEIMSEQESEVRPVVCQ